MKSAWVTVLSIVAVCVVAVAAFTPTPACADSWPPPKTWSATSANGACRFTAIPPPHDGFVPRDEEVRPTGILERLLPSGEWQEIWRRPLVNDVAPLTALITDDGRYVVTFDNWYSSGYGQHVVSIYRADGSLVRSRPLTDFVPSNYIETLETTTSSVYWRKGEGFALGGKTAWIDISFPVMSWPPEDRRTLRFTVDLSDGSIGRPSDAQWQAAMQEAEKVRAVLYPNAVE